MIRHRQDQVTKRSCYPEFSNSNLWQEIGERMNLSVTCQRLPWSRSLDFMKTGNIDAMNGLAYRDERAKYIACTHTPYYTCSTVFYMQQGEENLIKFYEDLYNY